METKHIFRMDDVCENMNWDNFNVVKDIFINNGVRPIMGVIPNNRDPELKMFPACKFDFWSEIKSLQDTYGWNVALHGYDHRYVTDKAGILGINKRSEFAGLSRTEQNLKIAMGKKVLSERGISINAFMAPAHSFDYTTVECLLENGINVVTDGFGYYPYRDRGMVFVPQLYATPRKPIINGIYTWCLHTNSLSVTSIKNLEAFVESACGSIIPFCDALDYITETHVARGLRVTSRVAISSLRKVRSLIKNRSVKE